jgi:hypothetical protein
VNLNELRQCVKQWDLVGSSVSPDDAALHSTLLNRLEYFGCTEWHKYLPTLTKSTYSDRLAAWIGNVNSEDERKILLQLASRIAYYSHDDFYALYESAFAGPITRWIVSTSGLRLDSVDFQSRLAEEIGRTWFCPVTDSMQINEFYKVVGISGVSQRPSFETLANLGPNQNNITAQIAYMMTKGLSRLVLLEDVIGTGSQVLPGVLWALKHLRLAGQPVPVLLVPLIICPQGAEFLRTFQQQLAAQNQRQFELGCVLELTYADVLGPKRDQVATASDVLSDKIEAFATATFDRVAGKMNVPPDEEPFSPFGFGEIGCTIVHRLNAPDNTLPLIHYQPPGGGWAALFPRLSRI